MIARNTDHVEAIQVALDYAPGSLVLKDGCIIGGLTGDSSPSQSIHG